MHLASAVESFPRLLDLAQWDRLQLQSFNFNNDIGGGCAAMRHIAASDFLADFASSLRAQED